MKVQIQISLFILAIIFPQNNVVSASVLAHKDQRLIETTCRNTPHYHLCITVLRADPRSGRAELRDLCLIVVAEIKKKTQAMLDSIDKMKKTAPSEMHTPLTKCHNYYNAVMIGNVPVAEQTVWGNPKFAENAMADTRNEAVMCEEAFENAVIKSPYTTENKYVEQVAEVARGMIRNLL